MEKVATEEAVWRACDMIVAEGRKVSGRSVKNEIGGSLTTIFQHIDGWKARGAKCTSFAAEIPVEVQKSILMALDKSAIKATEDLRRKREEVEDRYNEVMEILADSEQLVTNLETDLSDAQAKITDLQQLRERESAVTAETVIGMREQVATLNQEKNDLIHTREAANTEVATIQLLLERADLTATLSEEKVLELRKQVTALVQSKSDAEKGTAVADCHSQDLSCQIVKLEEHLKNAGVTIARFESERSELNRELNAAASACRKAEATTEQMSFRIQEAALTNEQFRKELEIVRKDSAFAADQMILRIQCGETTIQQLRKEIDSVRKEPIEFKNLPSVETTIEEASSEPAQQVELPL